MNRPAETASAGLIDSLAELSLRALPGMFDPERKLFCFRMRRTKNGLVREGYSIRYTLITLLGLAKYQSQTGRKQFDLGELLTSLSKRWGEMVTAGDIGLLVWAGSIINPEAADSAIENLHKTKSFRKFPDIRQSRTMEIAWLLAGLAHLKKVSGKLSQDSIKLVDYCYRALKNNYGDRGIFGHLGDQGIAGWLRGRIGTFADQVYPIYALTKFAEAWGREDALAAASACVQAICRHQGELGQWWWHYDRLSGKVAGRYPVYSVHQHGMAPMALFALDGVSASSSDFFVNRGLDWITGKNELGLNLVSDSSAMIWRSVYKPGWRGHAEKISSLRAHAPPPKPEGLTVLYECRPYCLGWLLYAWADRGDTKGVRP